MMMWHKLEHPSDLDELMRVFGRFHDSCIKQVFIRNREFVDEQLAMSFDNSPMVRLLFQRQAIDPSVIEIEFECVEDFNWLHDNLSANVESALIFNAVLERQKDLIFWADDTDWQSVDADKTNFRWLSAKAAKWRVVESGLGKADIRVDLAQ